MVVYFTKRRKIMSNQTKNGYVSLIKYVILQIITLGIYQWVWIYKTTNYLNTAKVKIRNAKTEFLLCIFLPFYFIYWLYASNEIVNNLIPEKKWHFVIDVLLIIYVPAFMCILMQNKINSFVCGEEKIEPATVKSYLRKSMGWHVLFCWAFASIWAGRTVDLLNFAKNGKWRNGFVTFLLCAICPLYLPYITYQYAKYLDVCGNNDLIKLILAFVSPQILSIIVQDKINELSDKATLATIASSKN